MSKKFATREEAAIYMIQNPGVEVVSSAGTRYRWHIGGIEFCDRYLWIRVNMMEATSYTLPVPEPKKEELPELGSALREVLRTQCCASCTEHFFRVLLAEAEARARAVAIEEIERAWVWEDDSKPKATAFFLKMPPEGSKLKRGES